jgi:DNA ligase-1
MKKELSLLVEIEKITGTGSQGEKQRLIRENYTPIMEYFLQVALDPFIKTNISKIEVLKHPITEKESNIDNTKKVLSKLIGSKAANNDMRAELHEVLNGSGLSFEEREMLGKIVSKSLNIGIGAKLVNKAVGKILIPDLDVMLAESDEEAINKWLEIYGHVWVEEKYDGVRVIAIKKNGIITFLTRNFNQLIGMSKVEASVEKLLEKFDNVFVDGELTDSDRKSVSGKINRILKGSAPANIDDDFQLHLFDFEDATIFNDVVKNPYEYRRERLTEIVEEYHINSNDVIKLSSRWKATTPDEIMGIYKRLVEVGGEGVIVKKPEHFYELKRSKNWNKIKEIQDCDLKITGWYEGRGKRKGKIGGFCCESECGKLKVEVGSGFSDDFINEISANPESYIGKIAKVLYNVRIVDKHGNHSLFLPRLEEIRSDKTVADDISKIK